MNTAPKVVTTSCSNETPIESLLSFLDLREEERLQRFIREAEQRCFFHRLVRVPAIDDRAFHEPHTCGPATARSMYERRLDAWRPDRLQELIANCRIRRRPPEGGGEG